MGGEAAMEVEVVVNSKCFNVGIGAKEGKEGRSTQQHKSEGTQFIVQRARQLQAGKLKKHHPWVTTDMHQSAFALSKP